MDGLATQGQQRAILKAYLAREVCRASGDDDLAHGIEKCPYCDASNIIKRGFDHQNRQRFKCKACTRSFTWASMSAFGASKISARTWLAFIDRFIEGSTLRSAASECGISLQTAWYMKQRLIKALPAN